MHRVGIDWADEKHDVCILAPDGRILSEFEIAHDWQGFQKLKAALTPLEPFQVNLERPNGLLVDWMVGLGWQVYVTPPRIVAHRRPRRSKNDRGDAFLLAHLRHLDDEDSRPLVIHSPLVEELKHLTRGYNQLKKHQMRITNQLTHVLKQYYPTAIGLFAKLQSPIALTFLEAFPTPQAAQALSREALADFLHRQKYRYPKRIEGIYHQLQQPIPPARVAAGYAAHAQALIAVLKSLNQQLALLKRQITTILNKHPEGTWWQQFPGVGVMLAAEFLAHFGDNREQFPSAEVLQATAGTVPIVRRSGKQLTVEFRKACSHSLRDATMNFAKNSIRTSGWAASYYRDQLARGHKPSRAHRALANRWLKIVWTLWQRRENYDEAVHVANRSRRGLSEQVA